MITGKRADLLVEVHAAGGWIDLTTEKRGDWRDLLESRVSAARACTRLGLLEDQGEIAAWGGRANRWQLTDRGREMAMLLFAKLSKDKRRQAHEIGQKRQQQGGTLRVFRGGPGGKVCPRCGCLPSGAGCAIAVDDGLSLGACVAAGCFDLEVCSACAVDYLHAGGTDNRPRCGASPVVITHATQAIAPPHPPRPRRCPVCFPTETP